MISVESGDCVGCVDVVVDFPTVVADAIAFQFDEVLNLAVAHSTVQDRLDLKLFGAIDKDRRRQWLGAMTRDRVR